MPELLIKPVNDELLTEEVAEVITFTPHWFVRRGNALFLLVVLLILLLTCLIQYPDIINASARIVAFNPPKLIIAKAEGKLVKIFVSNDRPVIKDQHLGYIESTANYASIILLQEWIDTSTKAAQDNNYNFILNHPLPDLTDLGEVQASYQSFQNELVIAKQTLRGGFYQKKKGALQQDLQFIDTLKKNTGQQKQLQEQDEQLQQKEYDAYETLAKDKVIAPLELNQYKSKLIAKEQSLKQLNDQMTNNNIATHNKRKEILDLEKEVIDQHQDFYSALLELKSEVSHWIQQYVLVAPEDGKLIYVSSLQENQFIRNGQELFYIQPPQISFCAELMAGQQGLGKIDTGQKVMIKPAGYPDNEFGYLPGRIEYISAIPNPRDSFLIKVSLPSGLRTNYGKTILFRNNLSAKAEIITDNRKLFDRLTGQLKQIWQR